MLPTSSRAAWWNSSGPLDGPEDPPDPHPPKTEAAISRESKPRDVRGIRISPMTRANRGSVRPRMSNLGAIVPRHRLSELMISLPALVPTALHVVMLMLFLTNFTEPSQNETFTPPE